MKVITLSGACKVKFFLWTGRIPWNPVLVRKMDGAFRLGPLRTDVELICRCDARGVIDRFWPSLEWSIEQELFTVEEASEMLADLILGSMEVAEA